MDGKMKQALEGFTNIINSRSNLERRLKQHNNASLGFLGQITKINGKPFSKWVHAMI